MCANCMVWVVKSHLSVLVHLRCVSIQIFSCAYCGAKLHKKLPQAYVRFFEGFSTFLLKQNGKKYQKFVVEGLTPQSFSMANSRVP